MSDHARKLFHSILNECELNEFGDKRTASKTDHFSKFDDGSPKFLLWRFKYFLSAIVVVIVWLYIMVVQVHSVAQRLIGLTFASSAVTTSIILSLVTHFLEFNVKVHFQEFISFEPYLG